MSAIVWLSWCVVCCLRRQLETLDTVVKFLLDERPRSFHDCVAWARNLFQANFSNTMRQLLFNFPADQTTSSGALFWSGTKRCPHPLKFDVKNVSSPASVCRRQCVAKLAIQMT